MLLNVVQIALEMLCFFKESTNLSDGPFYSSHRQMGIKQPANQSKCLMTKMSSVMTDFQNKSFCLSRVLLWRFECKKAAFDSNSVPKFLAQKKRILSESNTWTNIFTILKVWFDLRDTCLLSKSKTNTWVSFNASIRCLKVCLTAGAAHFSSCTS